MIAALCTKFPGLSPLQIKDIPLAMMSAMLGGLKKPQEGLDADKAEPEQVLQVLRNMGMKLE